MKITNIQAVNMINTLAAMGDKILPREVSYAVGKNLEALQVQIYKPYEKELEKINQRYMVLDGNNNQKMDACGRPVYTDPLAHKKELETLCEIENDFKMHTVSKEQLEQCDDGKYSGLTVREQMALMKMLEG
ncbi:MAG TPA: hypothetical protein DF613_16755 [Lachnospiraceae bacterium]|nr:hypothetical protein [Lachnospiraceae bacterium]